MISQAAPIPRTVSDLETRREGEGCRELILYSVDLLYKTVEPEGDCSAAGAGHGMSPIGTPVRQIVLTYHAADSSRAPSSLSVSHL